MDLELSTTAYFQHEQWFLLCDAKKVRTVESVTETVRGKKLINSYARVRYVFEDGTMINYHNGETLKTLDQFEYIEDVTV